MIATVDLDNYVLLEIEGHVLTGECNRCGACCMYNAPFPDPFQDGRCKHLISDEVNAAGEPIFRCEIYNKRPVGCALWPDLDDPVPSVCGLAWQTKVSFALPPYSKKKTQETKA
jgi:Fe-S-cluster containining protein